MGGETIDQIDKNKLTGEWEDRKDEFDGLCMGLRSKTYSEIVKDNSGQYHTHTYTYTLVG